MFGEIWYKVNKTKMELRVKLTETFAQKEHKWDYFLMMKSFIAIQKKSRWGSNMRARNGNCGFMRTYITCYIWTEDRSSCSQFFSKRVFLNFANFTGKYVLCSLFLIKLQAFRPVRPVTLLKETQTQVLSYEIYGIYKNTCFTEHLQGYSPKEKVSSKRKLSKTLLNKKRTHLFKMFFIISLLSMFPLQYISCCPTW